MEKRLDIADFTEEVNLIKDENLRKLTIGMLSTIPEYFYRIPASSSGKYHPQYALGEGGLARHTKAAVKIAESLLSLEQYKELPHDKIIMALIMHDTFKQGILESGHTVSEHPLLAASFVEHFNDEYHDTLYLVAKLIKSHMGEWYEPKPVTEAEKFVHLCDYLASRKFLEVLL